MRIQVISDVHTEFQTDSGRAFIEHLEPEGIQVLVVAGDLCDYWNIAKTLEELASRYAHVVYVFGNHEAYGSSMQRVREETRSAAEGIANLHFLDNSTCEIGGQRFVGTTLWFSDQPDNVLYEQQLNDFRKIHFFRETVYEENDRAQKFLRETVNVDDVVVTHHLPTYRCVSERFIRSELNRFFACNLDDVIFDQKPKLWVHGHTHDSKDFMHGETRIVCNPFGYAGLELNTEYVDQKVIEL